MAHSRRASVATRDASEPSRRWRWLAALAGLAPLLAPSAAPALEAGQKAPLFRAQSLDGGGGIALESHRGRVVYLDFWASWCAPCLTSLPLLDALRREFPAEQFRVLAVNVDRDPEKARRFLRRVPVGYPSATDPAGSIPERFGVKTMPTSFLIDRRGVIRHVHEGFRRGDIDGLRDRIRALLAADR